jgi:hypothetical protein
MKRLLIAVTALIAALAIGLATVSATAGAADHGAQVAKKKRKKKFAATISLTITFTPVSTYSEGSASYSGAVSSRGPTKCRSGRSVTLARNGAAFTSTFTNGSGGYSVSQNSAPAGGQYTATVRKRVFKKKNKKTGKKTKIICKAATSGPVTVP